MIKFNLFKPQIKPVKKPQTSILRGRVALAIIEDIDMHERMFKDGTYKQHFYNLKKSAQNQYTLANGNQILKKEGSPKLLSYIVNESILPITRLSLIKGKLGKKVTQETYKNEFRDLACRATNQHLKNYETLKDEHETSDRSFLKALVIDYIGNFKPKKKIARVPDLKVSKRDFTA